MLSSAKGEPVKNDDPVWKGLAITPADGADQFGESGQGYPRKISCTGAGNISVILAGDTNPVTLSVALGIPLECRPKRVRATGTTATGLAALW